ncbi:hypothetical protein BO71DRAFT_410683 [Aspergillus ellipticus CBS 707.79]|uniref:Uncharacterized protein n=1 Tax=Aspergillus ellipticus CBS 707.79 TaxID=1448320 RepID=A0A319D685_9EURO|nr:hypothetical protein BO71DRAFT_410683 [Aspergillus ellipticus CBS 707.79]
MEIPPEDTPSGWTNDPNRLSRAFQPDSGEIYLARCHGLEDIGVLFLNTSDSGEMGYIITSGNHYYIGDLMSDHIFEITKPCTLPEIARVIAAEGESELRCRKVKFVEWIPWEPQEVVEGPSLFVPPPNPPS